MLCTPVCSWLFHQEICLDYWNGLSREIFGECFLSGHKCVAGHAQCRWQNVQTYLNGQNLCSKLLVNIINSGYACYYVI